MKVIVFGVLQAPSTYYVTERLIAHGVQVAAIFLDEKENSDKDVAIWNGRTAGQLPWRGLDTLGVPVVRAGNLSSDACAARLKEWRADLVISAASARIYKENVLRAPRI